MRSLDSHREEGFTLLELLVAMFLGLLVLALGLSSMLVNRTVLSKETARTRLTQNLRGALDIIGTDIRIAGENVGSAFPAIEIIPGTSGGPSTLIVRRNLHDEVLPVCTTIASGSGTQQIFFAIAGSVSGCVYSGHTNDYNAWRGYRTAAGGTLQAFAYDTVNRRGEFFNYTGETDTGTQYYITRPAGTWTYGYTAGASAIYVLEEWKYQLVNGILQVTQNRDSANPLKVSFGISDFQVSAVMQDGSTRTTFAATDPWTQISRIQITISGQDNANRRTLRRTVSAGFFPRNILSS